MDLDMLWRHEFAHFRSKTVEEWMNAKVTAEIMESENWDDLSKETASFYLLPVTRPTTVSAELHRAQQGFLNSRPKQAKLSILTNQNAACSWHSTQLMAGARVRISLKARDHTFYMY